MIYALEFTKTAKQELSDLKKNDTIAYNKAMQLLDEISEHPRIGTGRPEILKYDYAGCWSRRINQKHRLIYRIEEEVVIVFVLKIVGHYDDK